MSETVARNLCQKHLSETFVKDPYQKPLSETLAAKITRTLFSWSFPNVYYIKMWILSTLE